MHSDVSVNRGILCRWNVCKIVLLFNKSKSIHEVMCGSGIQEEKCRGKGRMVIHVVMYLCSDAKVINAEWLLSDVQGKAAWQDRERERRVSVTEAANNHRIKASEAHRRWMKRNRVSALQVLCHRVFGRVSVSVQDINLLKTKRRLLYLNDQFVQRSKHF